MDDAPDTTDAPAPEDLDAASRDELYDLAREHDVEGRSSMTKDELRDALADELAGPGSEPVVSRVEDYRRVAEAAAAGAIVVPPRMLGPDDRRHHVRQTLREDHETRISSRSADARVKFDELSDSLFSFFRGTALLFYRDMAGEDAWMPTVLTLGDVHPENFGVMPNAHDVPIFAVNDFDEAYYAPFTWDLKRGAVGFMLAVEEEGGHGRKKQRKIARRFVRGYVEGIRRFAEEGTERDDEMRMDNAPDMIRELIEDALVDRAEWLAEDYLDEYRRGFRATDEHIPLTGQVERFQAVVDRLVAENDMEVPERAADMRVKDVCIRRGQGTASLGLDRYYLLIEGPNADGTDDLVIELKQARRSALTGLAPPTSYGLDSRGERIVHAQGAQLVRGDVFYGTVEIDGTSFMSRERSPYRDDVDLDDLSKKGWKRYAAICGHVLAHAHALSDDLGDLDHDIEPAILSAIEPEDLFVEDVVRWAAEAADRVRADHEAFRADHAMGAFEVVDRVYR